MIFPIDFGNVFILISLNILDIESEEETDINKLEEFNIGVQTYLALEREYEEFTMMGINLSTTKNDSEEHLYNEDNPYFEPNNAGYHSIIQISYIYNYCVFYLRFKIINNFFSRAIFRLIRKVYIFEETEHWIFTIRTTIYKIFISSLEHFLIYIKDETILKRC